MIQFIGVGIDVVKEGNGVSGDCLVDRINCQELIFGVIGNQEGSNNLFWVNFFFNGLVVGIKGKMLLYCYFSIVGIIGVDQLIGGVIQYCVLGILNQVEINSIVIGRVIGDLNFDLNVLIVCISEDFLLSLFLVECF